MHYYPIIKDSSGGGQATSGHKRIRCRGVEADPSSKNNQQYMKTLIGVWIVFKITHFLKHSYLNAPPFPSIPSSQHKNLWECCLCLKYTYAEFSSGNSRFKPPF